MSTEDSEVRGEDRADLPSDMFALLRDKVDLKALSKSAYLHMRAIDDLCSKRTFDRVKELNTLSLGKGVP